MCRARQTVHPVGEFATFHRSGACNWQTSVISH
jgi:hypothetical protein